MEYYQETTRQLKAQCKDLTRKIKMLPVESVECEQPFDMDKEKLDKIRFELITVHHKVLNERPFYTGLALENEFIDSFKEASIKKQIEDMDIIIKMNNESILNQLKDSELNKETRNCFGEILEAIEDKDDVEVERSEAKRKLFEVKSQTRYILEKFYPQHKSELLAILEKLEKLHVKEDEAEQWLDLSDHDITCVLILKRAMIIEQHKTELALFRFAPLI